MVLSTVVTERKVEGKNFVLLLHCTAETDRTRREENSAPNQPFDVID